jgi:branched-chain amino acid transport system substrate-binding protein
VLGWTASQYAEMFKKEKGYEPDYHPPQSSAAVMVYYHALNKAGTTDPQKVRDEIAKTDIQTFYGPIKFNSQGKNIGKGMAVIQLQDGKPKGVFPSSVAEGKLVYPKPYN